MCKLRSQQQFKLWRKEKVSELFEVSLKKQPCDIIVVVIIIIIIIIVSAGVIIITIIIKCPSN